MRDSSKTAEYAASFEDVQGAARVIAPYAHRTPVITCRTLDELAGRRLFFKCENFQRVGAFKFRGACHAVMKLPEEIAARGVATHSSGNHAQALALAAKLRGIRAHIVMPDNASAVKRRAAEGYGARVIECAPTLLAREETADRVVTETGATLIPPYDHPDIIAGAGTAALELLERVDELDAIVAPVGGGGLVSGTCLAAHGPRTGKERSRPVRVFAAEPQGADDAARAFASGTWVRQTDPRTVADGLLTSLGKLTWPILRDHAEDVITVSEDEIVNAMRLAWERAKLLIEPSSAVAIATVLTPSFRRLEGLGAVGVILSGGNVDLDHLPW